MSYVSVNTHTHVHTDTQTFQYGKGITSGLSLEPSPQKG